jgi:putative exosortase-associated protein (TIGR04073 family)
MRRVMAAATLFGALVLPSVGMADTAVDKLGRGLAGMTTGFLELPGNIVAETRDRGGAAGATIGFAKGLGMIPVRELIGVYEFVTAPFPLPDNYEPLVHPEYPWDYFEGSSSARAAS